MLNAVLALNQLDTNVFGSPALGDAPRVYDEHVTVPDAHLLFNGEFKRVGTSDLKIVGQDGQSFFIRDYFTGEKRANLMSPEGATLSAHVVEALAGPLAPGQFAQAGGQAAPSQPVIGRVDALTGSATVVRNGVSVALNVGDNVRKGDVVQTSGGSSVAIVFSDGTTFSLNANARMVLNDFVFNAGGTGNSAAISLVQGAFSFVAGQVAKTGEMRVETPVATMGIRGTAVLVEISANDGQTRFSVMVEPDGTTGSFNLYNKTTGALLATVNNSQVGWVVTPAGPLQVVAQQEQKTPAQLQQELGIVQQIFTIFNNNQQNPFTPTQDRGDNPNNANPQTAGSSGSGTPPSDTAGTGNSLVDQINTASNNPSTPPTTATVPLTTDPLPTTDPGSQQPPAVTVTVSPNQAPVAQNDSTNVPSGNGSGDVIQNDNDPEGSVISVISAQQLDPNDNTPIGSDTPVVAEGTEIEGTYGTLTLHPDGTYTYAPHGTAFAQLADGETAVEVFRYTISDPFGATASATLTINVTGANDAPVVDLSPVITRISVPDALPEGANPDAHNAIAPAVSNDGRYVVFFSALQPPDENNDNDSQLHGDVFLYDRLTGTTTTLTDSTHIETRPSGEFYVGFSISGDGRYVVFEGVREVVDDFGHHNETHVYVYDRLNDSTELLRNPATLDPYVADGTPRISGGLITFATQPQWNGTTFDQHILVTNVQGQVLTNLTASGLGIGAHTWIDQVDISGNGRYLTFWSQPQTFNQFGPNEPDGPATLYTYDRVFGTKTAIATTDTTLDDDPWWASMSDDGSVVVFQSNLSLVAADTNDTSDIYLWDRASGSIELITLAADGGSIRPSISSDGRYITFASEASNLVPGDTNGQPDTFVYDRVAHTFERISLASDGTQGDGDSSFASDVSSNGRIVVFSGTASNLVPGDNNNYADVFIVDRSGGTISSVGEDGSVSQTLTLDTHGAFAFSDVDLNDTHTVLVTGAQITNAPAGFIVPPSGLGTFAASIVENSSDSDPSGQVAWSFSVDNALVQGLGAGQRVTQTYTIEIDDGHGGTASQDVRVTITGRNDGPVVTSAALTGIVNAEANPISQVAAGYLTAGHNLINGLGSPPNRTETFGEYLLAANDDGSTGAINIISVFGEQGLNFFGTNYTSFFINNNGNITFLNATGQFTPSQIAGGSNNPIIAPFWADVDTRGTPGNTTPGGNSTGSNLVYYDFDTTNGVVTITWDDVGYFSSQTNKLNAFQLQLIDRGNGDFDIVFRYENIDWTTGGASGGINGLGGTPARAGYTAGDGNSDHYFELSGSGSEASMLALETTAGNTGIPGVHVFHVRSGEVQQSTTTGTIAFSDADITDTHIVTYAFNPAASGHLTALGAFTATLTQDTIGGTGGLVAWNYNIDPLAIGALAPGSTHNEVFNVVIGDGNGGVITQQVTVTVNGPSPQSEAPTIGFEGAETAEYGSTTTVLGLTVADADANESEEFHVTVEAGHGTLSMANGALNAFDLDASPDRMEFYATLEQINDALALGITYTNPAYSQGLTDKVTLAVTDSHGASDAINFIFNVFGDSSVALTGTDGKDVIFGTGYNDTFTGGAGNDTFVFGNEGENGSGQDIITDFTQNQDRIALYGYASMSDFTLDDTDQGIEIDLGDGSVVILSGFHGSLSSTDFIFHPALA